VAILCIIKTQAEVVVLLSLSLTFTNLDIPQLITILLESVGCIYQ